MLIDMRTTAPWALKIFRGFLVWQVSRYESPWKKCIDREKVNFAPFLGRGSFHDDGSSMCFIIFHIFRSFQKVGIDEDLNHLNHWSSPERAQDQHVPIIFHHVFKTWVTPLPKWMIYKRFLVPDSPLLSKSNTT